MVAMVEIDEAAASKAVPIYLDSREMCKMNPSKSKVTWRMWTCADMFMYYGRWIIIKRRGGREFLKSSSNRIVLGI
jgi:hypothetical protein